jgi:EAL domain-containing protein (putative c-di-GMP-specific phosphodiesterase class I)
MTITTRPVRQRHDTISVRAHQESAAGQRSVLVVDDDEPVCRALERVLRKAGFEVTMANDSGAALDLVMHESFDVVLSDVNMAGMSGIDLLRVLRTYDLDVPVILITGNPTLDVAMEAMHLGALQYLPKPTPNSVVVAAVERASRLHQVAALKRSAMERAELAAGHEAALSHQFERALDSLWMAFQPIVAPSGAVFGYEALMRNEEPALPHPGAVLDAAQQLGRGRDLGRRIRELSAEAFTAAPERATLFVNLHVQDLLDPNLYATDAPLSQIAERVILEITERAAIDALKDLHARISVLRYQGFRIAIDDLGAGYAGLSSFVALEPEIVKLDMSLVRNAHESPVQRRVIESMTTLCKEMNIQVVAEGVETSEERVCMQQAGCDLLQGYLFAKPARPFPSVSAVF